MFSFESVKPNLEAEQSVLGAVIIDQTLLPEVMTILKPEHFYRRVHKEIFSAMTEMFADNKPIDAVTILAYIKRRKVFESDEAASRYIIELAEIVPGTANTAAYANLVADTHKRQNAYDLAQELADVLVDGSMDACQNIAGKLQESLSHSARKDTWHVYDAFVEFYINYGNREYVSTGFAHMDNFAHINLGDFVIVGARPSIGKTALTLQMAQRIAQKHTVAYFSLETNRETLIGRLLSANGRDGMTRIKRGEATREGLYEAGKKLQNTGLHIVEAAGWSVNQIRAKAIQLGAEVIFIDYMGLIMAEGKGRYEKMTNISIDLHTLAQQSRMTVFALCQLNRDGTGRPTMEHLRESGQIEQDADVILLIDAPNGKDAPERTIDIAKNKEGKTGIIPFNFIHEGQTFMEVERR